MRIPSVVQNVNRSKKYYGGCVGRCTEMGSEETCTIRLEEGKPEDWSVGPVSGNGSSVIYKIEYDEGKSMLQ